MCSAQYFRLLLPSSGLRLDGESPPSTAPGHEAILPLYSYSVRRASVRGNHSRSTVTILQPVISHTRTRTIFDLCVEAIILIQNMKLYRKT